MSWTKTFNISQELNALKEILDREENDLSKMQKLKAKLEPKTYRRRQLERSIKTLEQQLQIHRKAYETYEGLGARLKEDENRHLQNHLRNPFGRVR
jgi:dynactin complex subunit